MRRYNLKEFELSQSYLFFWDKLEKANYFLEQILDTTDEELDGRLVQALMSSPVGDGGQWDMVANLVEKYGLVSECTFFLRTISFYPWWFLKGVFFSPAKKQVSIAMIS